nr:hypothetical protein [Pirellula staleyi]
MSVSNRDWLLRESGEIPTVEEAIEAAIESGALVIVESPRSAAFAGHEIEIDWVRHDRLWGFLWHLARHAKGNRPIDRLTFGDKSRANVVTDLKSKLSKMAEFPVTLADMITVVGKGTQKLCLPPEKIRIFECLDGNPSEWHP